MFVSRRYFLISRIVPLALVGAGIVALLPSDFKAAASSMNASTSITQPATGKVSMPAPKLLTVAIAQPAPTIGDATPSQPEAVAPSSTTANSVADSAASQSPDPGLAQLRDAQIGTSGVNVRAGASGNFAVLFTLAPGASIRTRETLNGWVHVYADSADGWIYASYLAGNQPTTTTAATAAATSQSAAGASLVGRTVRLRSQSQVYDSPGGHRIYVLDAGTRVRVAEAANNWIRIITSNDESGWLRLR
jgi:SH3-like domain-containing protein